MAIKDTFSNFSCAVQEREAGTAENDRVNDEMAFKRPLPSVQ